MPQSDEGLGVAIIVFGGLLLLSKGAKAVVSFPPAHDPGQPEPDFKVPNFTDQGGYLKPNRQPEPEPFVDYEADISRGSYQPTLALRFDDWRNILAPYYPGLDLMNITITLGLPPLVGGGNKGITLGDNVYFDPAWWGTLSDGQKLSAMAHELVHVRQWKERGVLFLLDYLSQSFRPHDDITLEAEAISQEKFVAGQLGVPYVSA